MRFDGGYLSRYFVTDPERMETIYEDVYILLHEKKISKTQDLLPILEHVAKTAKPLLIIAEAVEGEALAALVVNKIRGTVKCVAVKAPAIVDQRNAMLEEIATLAAGRIITDESGSGLRDLTLLDLGRAKRITVSEDNTVIEFAPVSKN